MSPEFPIKKAQSDYFNAHQKYAANFEELGFDFSSYIQYINHKFYLSDKTLIKEIGINEFSDKYLAIAKADKLGGFSERASYCTDVWIIGEKTPLSHIKKGLPCDSKSFISLVDAIICGSFLLITLAFIIEHIIYTKKHNKALQGSY